MPEAQLPTKYGASPDADSHNRHTFPVQSDFGRTRGLEICQRRQNAANRRDADTGYRTFGDYCYPGGGSAEWADCCCQTNWDAACTFVYYSANNHHANRCKYARTNEYTNRNGYARAACDANEYKYAVAHEYAYMDGDAKRHSHSDAYTSVGSWQYACI